MRGTRHERKPSPDRHPSASAAEKEAEQAARADCGGSSRRTYRARNEDAAHIFTLPQAGSQAGGLVATVNAAWRRRATLSDFVSLGSQVAPIGPLSRNPTAILADNHCTVAPCRYRRAAAGGRRYPPQ